ncbi:ImmA/IrrE family metallo-endopeptidase [Paenibacillus whitsoniae]|uniref:ImmA/IrrE family metallo-endopeptidase n=1 Tax=Paenibacillus whitsoniae TaxID=2496558 RepID=A0A430J7J7_9BACL|nr:ImmA/IrrE family metallo-endopeptidase [Paenibacillus whitsoniae]RTE05514.1 ImmA/IrrE family metallo-endopeptidase [Paenibacillus whitsoniae]
MAIKQLVSQLIRKYGTNNPFTIAAEKNILILFEPLGEMMGYFNTYKRIPMIHINSGLDEVDQRFTCAHELGHAVLHPKVNTPFLRRHTLQSIEKIEKEANTLAVELLIPDESLLTGVSIYDAARLCGVPEEVAHLKKPPRSSFWRDENTYFNF